MKNKVAYSARNDGMVNLIDEIPLSKPLGVNIEITGECNYKCVFCPRNTDEYNNSERAKHMTIQTFDKTLDNLRNWDRKRIKCGVLNAIGESILNPNFIYMIGQNFSSLFERTTLVTNASLLKGDAAKAVLDSDLTYLKISISSLDQKRHEEITQSKTLVSEIYENIAEFKSNRDALGKGPYIYVKTIAPVADSDEVKDFLDKYSPLADEIGVEELTTWNGRENFYALSGVENTQDEWVQRVCPSPFFKMYIRNNGDVNLCGADYMCDLFMGNVHDALLKDIWLSKKANDMRNDFLLRKQQEYPACSKCDFLTTGKITTTSGAAAANIDSLTSEEFTSRLKEKFRKGD